MSVSQHTDITATAAVAAAAAAVDAAAVSCDGATALNATCDGAVVSLLVTEAPPPSACMLNL